VPTQPAPHLVTNKGRCGAVPRCEMLRRGLALPWFVSGIGRAGITSAAVARNGGVATALVLFLHWNIAMRPCVDELTGLGGDHSAGEILMSKKAAGHHKQVAEYLKHAAFHHEEAAKHHETGHHETAAHHAHIATGHIIHARGHAEEAVKAHVAEHDPRHGTEQRRASA
jgi:hypothetical protein